MNKKIFLITGLVLLVAMFVYLMPLLEEFQRIEISLFGLCIGTGCHSYSASSTSNPGVIDCRGYQIGIFCLSSPEKYCRYVHPFTSREKCLCELKDYGYSYRSHYYCERNGKCYTNSFEYDFGCSDDMERSCREIEKVFTEPNACSSWWGTAESYGFVDKKAECSQSWEDIYISGNEDRKNNIYNGFIDDGTHINDICRLLCSNCNSKLCNKGNICEYTTILVNNS